VGNGGTTIADYRHTFDSVGNRVTVTELSGRTVTYAYDPLYRLSAETITGDPTGPNGIIGYTYDAVGNRLTRTSTLASLPAEDHAYDRNDRVSGDTFDGNGNTLVTGPASYAYDSADRLTRVDAGTTTFVYDGDGQRIAKTVDGTTTFYLVDDRNPSGQPQVLEEIVNGAVARTYTHGLALISQRTEGGAVSVYHYDGQRSVRLLTDTAASVTDTYDYEAFGTVLRATGSTPNTYLFRGEQLEPALGSYYLRARYYRPSTGRFLTADSWSGDTMTPQTLNRYAYPSNNPVTLADPTGHTGLAEVGVGIAIGNILAGLPDATPRPTRIVGGGPFKTLTVDVVSWLIGADSFIEQAEAANNIYGMNGGRIKIELGSFRELREESLGFILGRDNKLDDRCAGSSSAGNLQLGLEVKRLLADQPRDQNRITLYYVPRLFLGADGLTFQPSTCGGDPVAAGAPFITLATETSFVDTLAHELVHALADLRDLTDDSLSNRLLYGYGATRTGHILTKDEIRKLRASPYLTP
jgi:RHS repeat-associated protein